MYSKLEVELEGYHKDDENSYTYYRNDMIIIKIYYVETQLWQAIEKIEVWLQVKQLETNKVIMKAPIGLDHTSYLKASWKYVWDQKDLNKKQVDPGVYVGIITSGELSGVIMFKIIEQRK
jgi:hypothetical protein